MRYRLHELQQVLTAVLPYAIGAPQNKPLLIANKGFIPYLVDALLLDPGHPRAEMKEDLKAWCQQHHCEALAQLSVHEDCRLALLQDPSVVPALEAVVKTGLTQETRGFAEAALVALRDKKLHMAVDGQKHVMLSCELIQVVASCNVLRLIFRWRSALLACTQINGIFRRQSGGQTSL